MPFDHSCLTNYRFAESHQSYGERDTMLYALGLGIGSDPVNPGHLRYVYEQDLQALPTMGVVLAHPGFWAGIEELGIDWVKMLHVGQGLTLHRPIPVAGSVTGRSRITDVVDRGASGALLFYERDVIEDATGDLVATVRQTLLCRGNGGFAGGATAAPPPHQMPARAADNVVEWKTLPQMALIYRLSGDMNPLHANPATAEKAGFARPILHGLATFGIGCFALLQGLFDYEASGLRSFDVRFTSPVFPGETIRTELWRDDDQVSIRSTAVERNKIVMDNGLCSIVNP